MLYAFYSAGEIIHYGNRRGGGGRGSQTGVRIEAEASRSTEPVRLSAGLQTERRRGGGEESARC